MRLGSPVIWNLVRGRRGLRWIHSLPSGNSANQRFAFLHHAAHSPRRNPPLSRHAQAPLPKKTRGPRPFDTKSIRRTPPLLDPRPHHTQPGESRPAPLLPDGTRRTNGRKLTSHPARGKIPLDRGPTTAPNHLGQPRRQQQLLQSRRQ